MKKIILLTAALFTVSVCGSCTEDEGKTGASSGEFNFLTYNVAGLPTEIHPDTHPEVYNKLISPLLNYYDVALVQEDFFYHEDLISKAEHKYISLHYKEYYYDEDAGKYQNLGDGLNIFSNYEFTTPLRCYWGTCFGEFTNASDCLANKGFFKTTLTLAEGAEVDVYNLHHEAGSGPEDDLYREMQVTTLTRFINVNSTGRAVIVAGDFNLHGDALLDEGSLEGTDEKQIRRYLEDCGLADVCRELDCSEERIDKIMFRSSDEVELTALEWVNDKDLFQYTGDDTDLLKWGTDLSDHQPVAAVFSWKSR